MTVKNQNSYLQKNIKFCVNILKKFRRQTLVCRRTTLNGFIIYRAKQYPYGSMTTVQT